MTIFYTICGLFLAAFSLSFSRIRKYAPSFRTEIGSKTISHIV